jgi:anti-sigma factor RsiW
VPGLERENNMNESEYRALIESSWRRPLSAEAQARLEAWLHAHPESHNNWEAESTLNRLLERLPDAPVASNFTARVMQAVERESAAAVRSTSILDRVKQWFWRPAPRVAWALGLAGLLAAGYYQHRTNVRGEIAKGLTVLANVATLSDPATLQDFEAIQRLAQSAPDEDEELLALLQK